MKRPGHRRRPFLYVPAGKLIGQHFHGHAIGFDLAFSITGLSILNQAPLTFFGVLFADAMPGFMASSKLFFDSRKSPCNACNLMRSSLEIAKTSSQCCRPGRFTIPLAATITRRGSKSYGHTRGVITPPNAMVTRRLPSLRILITLGAPISAVCCACVPPQGCRCPRPEFQWSHAARNRAAAPTWFWPGPDWRRFGVGNRTARHRTIR